MRLVMADILTDNGYTVLESDTGQAAMRHILSPARIDLLMTDVGLPGGINGRQLADAARQQRRDLKVPSLTGYDEQAAFGSGQMEMGMAIMPKPFNIDLLSTKVNDVLQAPSGELKPTELD